jgi:hypothetical protein
MHAQTTPRPEPYVWVSWITKLLAGEASCVWSAWFRAHYQTAKAPNGFDTATWQMDHAAMLRKAAEEHEKEGLIVHTEGQNLFALKGKVGTLSGKPDMVALNGDEGWVVDTKTGLPKLSDRIQVMIYMWAFPKTIPAFAGVKLHGKVVYKLGTSIITPEEVDAAFIKKVVELMKVICGETPPRKAPSFTECQHCPITPEDCADRAGTVKVYEGQTDEF